MHVVIAGLYSLTGPPRTFNGSSNSERFTFNNTKSTTSPLSAFRFLQSLHDLHFSQWQPSQSAQQPSPIVTSVSMAVVSLVPPALEPAKSIAKPEQGHTRLYDWKRYRAQARTSLPLPLRPFPTFTC